MFRYLMVELLRSGSAGALAFGRITNFGDQAVGAVAAAQASYQDLNN